METEALEVLPTQIPVSCPRQISTFYCWRPFVLHSGCPRTPGNSLASASQMLEFDRSLLAYLICGTFTLAL